MNNYKDTENKTVLFSPVSQIFSFRHIPNRLGRVLGVLVGMALEVLLFQMD